MKYNPMYFSFERGAMQGGILPNPVDTNIDLPRYPATGLRKIETDNICVKIMI